MIDIIVQANCVPNCAQLYIERAVKATLKFLSKSGDVTIVIVDNKAIHTMNKEYRDIDHATDVLSFPSNEGEAVIAPPDNYLGDIVISYERAVEQAQDYGHSVEREVTFLTIHGMLHLIGYDHMTEEDEKTMFTLQNEILNYMECFR